MVIEIKATAADLFNHMLMLGLATIIEDANPSVHCLTQWDERLDRFRIDAGTLTLDDAADIVSNHAKHAAESLQLNSTFMHGKHSTMSPRISNITTSDDWRQLQQARNTAIDNMSNSMQRRYWGALGQPASWCERSDWGASRWEMVARNGGNEFVNGRLLPLAEAVANRTVQQVESGLSGDTLIDEIGHNKTDSRTATGLHSPQPTDNAKAWCALMGVANFPTIPSIMNQRSATSAVIQQRGHNPTAAIPLTSQWTTMAKTRSILRSLPLIQASKNKQWLKAQHVEAVCIFNQYVSDNINAPERWFENATITSLV